MKNSNALEKASSIINTQKRIMEEENKRAPPIDNIMEEVESLHSPDLQFNVVSDLVSMSLYFEDIYHRNPSVYEKTLTIGAKNEFHEKNDILETKAEILDEINSMKAEDECKMSDVDAAEAKAEKIIEYLQESIPELNEEISKLESVLRM